MHAATNPARSGCHKGARLKRTDRNSRASLGAAWQLPGHQFPEEGVTEHLKTMPPATQCLLPFQQKYPVTASTTSPHRNVPCKGEEHRQLRQSWFFSSLGTKGGSSGKPSNRWRRNFSLAKWKVRAGRGTKQNATGISSLHPTVLLHVKIKPWVTTVKGRADHRNTGLFFSPVH